VRRGLGDAGGGGMGRCEVPADRGGIRHVNRPAFGQDEEARLVGALREGGPLRGSPVAGRAGQNPGPIPFIDLPRVGEAGTVPALALAPLAVLPAFQRQGIGSALVRTGLDECRRQGYRIVIVLGHPQYYPRFGFSPNLAASLASPFSHKDAFMALELVP